jgi:hypothetical protein
MLPPDTAGDGSEHDHADWAEAQIVTTSGQPLAVAPDHAEIVMESLRKPAQVWTLCSGEADYRLRHTVMDVDCLYLSPNGCAPAEAPFELRPDSHFRVEGRDLGLEDLVMVDATTPTNPSGGNSLQVIWPFGGHFHRGDHWVQIGMFWRRMCLPEGMPANPPRRPRLLVTTPG